jgi:hypothetical protein
MLGTSPIMCFESGTSQSQASPYIHFNEMALWLFSTKIATVSKGSAIVELRRELGCKTQK